MIWLTFEKIILATVWRMDDQEVNEQRPVGASLTRGEKMVPWTELLEKGWTRIHQKTEKVRKGKRKGNNQWLPDLWVEHLGGWGQKKKWGKKHSECTDPTHLPLDLYVSISVWRGAAVKFF